MNTISKVAIIGATGRVGGAFASALLATGKHSVTAICRAESQSNSSLPAGIKSIPVNYDDEASLVSALTGQQFLIITLSVRAPQDLHSKIVHAAAKAGVPHIMPNIFGNDITNEQFCKELLYGERSMAAVRDMQSVGIDYTVMCCGFWYEWSLALGEAWFGFDIAARKVTFFDDGMEKISVSTWDQCGRAVAALLSLPVSSGGDGKPGIEDWKNKPLFIASFEVSQRDMLDSLNRVLGTTDADWEITREPTGERYARGLNAMQKGDMRGFATAMYTRTFYPTGEGNFQDRLVNDVLGLPKEDLDEVTKRTVAMVESGWNPFGESAPNVDEVSRSFHT